MNKTEMADRLAARTGLGKGAARDAVDGVFAIIGEALADGEDVRTQPEDRRGRFDFGVHLADVQGGEDAEGQREWPSGIVTVRREKTATGSAANRLHVESGQFLYDDGHPACCEPAIGNIQGVHRVGGSAAEGSHAASRIRQEGCGGGSTRSRTNGGAEV